MSRYSPTVRSSVPRLVDHSGGDLGSRLTGGDDAPRVDHELTLHDLGAHADGALIDLLDDASVFGVVVPRDPALAAGGRVPLNRLTRESRRAQGELVSYLRERLASHRDAR
ncbi:hypothetical protein [Frigoribacterium sp. MCBA15_019]|uniref:hypothetical protein n=1 Tax=Frigoribacterium sp. MCBA15_019 TaxID=1898745 RepID=UPI00115F8194|nr:hypothetical protein [Frigoribacterium sp. MCBA15_019]